MHIYLELVLLNSAGCASYLIPPKTNCSIHPHFSISLSPALALFHPGELSLCRTNNGGCQDLCLLSPKGEVTCSCRGDRTLQEDFTCKGEHAQRCRWMYAQDVCMWRCLLSKHPFIQRSTFWGGEKVEGGEDRS